MTLPTLKEYRNELGISLAELSRRANVDYKTAKRAEDGEAIKQNKAIAIARALSQALERTIKPEEIEGLKIW